jgi:hypothetical protein
MIIYIYILHIINTVSIDKTLIILQHLSDPQNIHHPTASFRFTKFLQCYYAGVVSHHVHHLQVTNFYISPTKFLQSHSRRSSSTGVVTQKLLRKTLLHRSSYAGVVTQELLHWSHLPGGQLVSLIKTPTSQDLLFHSFGGSGSQASSIETWPQRSRVSDAQMCGAMRVSSALGQPFAEMQPFRAKSSSLRKIAIAHVFATSDADIREWNVEKLL